MSAFKDKWEYFITKHLKKRMFCPACNNDSKMKYNRKTGVWECQSCDYIISDEKLRDNYVFWFCDKCKTFLNDQTGFDIKRSTWKCTKCDFENNITISNIVNLCKDCGKIIQIDSNDYLCDDCRTIRKQNSIERLKTAGIIAGTAIAVVAAYYSSESSDTRSDESGGGSSTYFPNLDPDAQDLTDCEGKMKCANCGNENPKKLWDDDDTIYCSECCHRTVKETRQDDLIECPYCKRLRDRKAYQCLWCGHSLNETDPPTPEVTLELNEILSDFDKQLDSSNKRYWNIRKK